MEFLTFGNLLRDDEATARDCLSTTAWLDKNLRHRAFEHLHFTSGAIGGTRFGTADQEKAANDHSFRGARGAGARSHRQRDGH